MPISNSVDPSPKLIAQIVILDSSISPLTIAVGVRLKTADQF
jgi:hypothetical protein